MLGTVTQSLAELYSTVGWKIELTDESGYLTEEICKVLKVQPDFSLLLMVKCKGEKK